MPKAWYPVIDYLECMEYNQPPKAMIMNLQNGGIWF